MKAIKNKNELAGTSRKGSIIINFDELLRTFGEPERCPDNPKIQAEWAFKLGGLIFTIYDYKSNLPVTENTRWSIGGNSSECAYVVQRQFDEVGAAYVKIFKEAIINGKWTEVEI